MASALYSELRKEMHRKGVTSGDIAKWLGISSPSVSARFTARIPWEVTEIYIILDKMHLPYHKLHVLFPKDGMWAGSLADPPPTAEDQLISAIKALINKAS